MAAETNVADKNVKDDKSPGVTCSKGTIDSFFKSPPRQSAPSSSVTARPKDLTSFFKVTHIPAKSQHSAPTTVDQLVDEVKGLQVNGDCTTLPINGEVTKPSKTDHSEPTEHHSSARGKRKLDVGHNDGCGTTQNQNKKARKPNLNGPLDDFQGASQHGDMVEKVHPGESAPKAEPTAPTKHSKKPSSLPLAKSRNDLPDTVGSSECPVASNEPAHHQQDGDSVLEISYADFLLEQSPSKSAVQEECPPQDNDSEGRKCDDPECGNLAASTSEVTRTSVSNDSSDEQIEDDSPKPVTDNSDLKGMSSITKFFNKSERRHQGKKDTHENSVIVIEAEVHPEPSPPEKSLKTEKSFSIFNKDQRKSDLTVGSEALLCVTDLHSPSMKSPKSNAVVDADLTITFIESADIVEPSTKKRPLSAKRVTLPMPARVKKPVSGNAFSIFDKGRRKTGFEPEAENEESTDDIKEASQPSETNTPAVDCKETTHTPVKSKQKCESTKLLPKVESTDSLSNNGTQSKTVTSERSAEECSRATAKGKEKAKGSSKKLTIDKDEIERQKAQTTEKMAYLDNVVVSGKCTAQATLNFGQKGMMTMQKECPTKTKTRRKPRKLSSSGEEELATDRTAPRSEGTRSNATKKKEPKSKSEALKADDDDGIQEHGTDGQLSMPRKTLRARKRGDGVEAMALRSVYKSVLVNNGRGKVKTPLKLRLTRVSTEDDEGAEAFTPKSKVGQSKAQQLLQKAKATTTKAMAKTTSRGHSAKINKDKKSGPMDKVKVKSKQHLSDESEPSLRRSTRACLLTAREVISISYQDGSTPRKRKGTSEDTPEPTATAARPKAPKTPSKTQRKGNGEPTSTKSTAKAPKTPSKTPRKNIKQSPKKTPTKTSKGKKVKMAPIFSGSAKQDDNTPVEISDDSAEEIVELSPEELEAQRVRRLFLLSGVPQELRRQKATQDGVQVSDYPPIPTISHVQQIPRKPAAAKECDEKPDVDNATLDKDARPAEGVGSTETATGQMARHRVSGSRMEMPPLVDPWNLPAVLLPKLRCNVIDSSPSLSCDLLLGSVSECGRRVTCPTVQCDPPFVIEELKEELVRYLLAEINTFNISFPVRRIYRLLTKKKRDDEKMAVAERDINEPSTRVDGVVESAEGNLKPFNKKRKLPDECEITADNKRRKGRRKSSDSDVILLDDSLDKDRWKGEHEAGSVTEDTGHRRSSRRLSLRGRRSSLDEDAEEVDFKAADASSSQNAQDPNCLAPSADKQENADSLDGAKELMWTEKYAPNHSVEVVGHTNAVKKLKGWLLEWKHRTDLENRRLRREQLKQAKRAGNSKEEIRKKLAQWWMDDDSDFDLSQEEDSDLEEEEEEDDSLTNTVLLTGPHGIGKTALVFALAQELGYKVFEVNASSKRTGKHILTQLKEATQSHQVCKKNLDTVFTSLVAAGADEPQTNEAKAKAEKSEKKLPPAFANFLKKPAASRVTAADSKGHSTAKHKGKDPHASKSESVHKTPSKSRKAKKKSDDDVTITGYVASPRKNTRCQGLLKMEPSSCSGSISIQEGRDAETKKGLDLSSVSLILFEEADIAFEEDKGFWAAVQTFMTTTKRPILLTANDPDFLNKFKGRMDHLTLTTPSINNITSYLQLVCLTENLRTDFDDVRSLVGLLGGDIRQLLLVLQYWVRSGGSVHHSSEPVRYRKQCLKDKDCVEIAPAAPSQGEPVRVSSLEANLTATFPAGSSQDSEDEFQCQPARKKTHRLRRRVVIEDDESSMDSCAGSPEKAPVSYRASLDAILEEDDSQSSQQLSSRASSQMHASQEDMVVVEDSVIPKHQLCFESIVGASQFIQGGPTPLNTLKTLLQDQSLQSCELQVLFHQLGYDILYSNLLHMLPLPKVKATPRQVRPILPSALAQSRKTASRIRNLDDLYDSEASSDGFSTLDKVQTGVAKCESSTEDKELNCGTLPEQKGVCKGEPLVSESLSVLASMYDTISLVDSRFVQCPIPREGTVTRNEFDWWSGVISPGDTDDKCNFEMAPCWKSKHATDLAAFVQVSSALRARDGLSGVMDRCSRLELVDREEISSRLSLPVDDVAPVLAFSQESSIMCNSIRQANKKAAERISGTLPLHLQGNRSALALDYFPSLRLMCQSEQLRLATSTKRRFLHYLDEMVKQWKQSTLDTMCTSLQ